MSTTPIEAVFKAFGKALSQAVSRTRGAGVPSTKGVCDPVPDALHRRLRIGQPALGPEGLRTRGRGGQRRFRSAAMGRRRLVLPGVGAFGAAMAQLEELGLVGPILERIEAGVPFLGVCLGLQLLFEGSEEDPGACGLGIVRGDVRALPPTVKVPHIGWNQIEAVPVPTSSRASPTVRPSTSCTGTPWCRAPRPTCSP